MFKKILKWLYLVCKRWIKENMSELLQHLFLERLKLFVPDTLETRNHFISVDEETRNPIAFINITLTCNHQNHSVVEPWWEIPTVRELSKVPAASPTPRLSRKWLWKISISTRSQDQRKPLIMSMDEGRDLPSNFLASADSPNVSLNAESIERCKRRRKNDLSNLKMSLKFFWFHVMYRRSIEEWIKWQEWC